MSDLVISAENLSKCYLRSGSASADAMMKYRTLAETVVQTWQRWTGRSPAATQSEFWALRDVSFDVQQGESVGLIGANGAGKSTLLRLLSQITEPTSGRACLRGRVASLLEVGAGLHPELTGRENIHLYGSLHGLSRQEIRRSFDAIVDFAGVEKFLDMPVKRYSSGMYVRLAFSVAAHVMPDILFVDEVLAVGDAEFRAKCVQKIRSAVASGCTVLFVSHQLSLLSGLCPRSLVIQNGRLVFDGSSAEAIGHYLQPADQASGGVDLAATAASRPGSGQARVASARLETLDGRLCSLVQSGSGCRLTFEYRTQSQAVGASVRAQVRLMDDAGQPLFGHHSVLAGDYTSQEGAWASGVWSFIMDRLPLVPGSYLVAIDLWVDGRLADCVEPAFQLKVAGGDYYGTGQLSKSSHGRFCVDARWMHAVSKQD